MKHKIIITSLLLVSSFLVHADIGNSLSQQTCTQLGTDAVPIPPTHNDLWNVGGLNRSLDRQVYGLEVVAYKIQWSNGWSQWYVKGVNDLVALTTPNATTPTADDARLAWIYFWDHNFQVIYCS